ncbi:methylated-DNA--protein-cysteine methyltransferase [Patiriisocius marinistellae]|uniref:Methylated-DNA--protein-cysteine methyltransferase n=1 Tax=Patiriisocius marinistellae TaxID=2494560 RepID=A0A5J4FXD6_9FLAO|nr:methylated-DNA--[protein]-cysteine S-methyltransferase [Patiriisocius marinistellae]GEQ84796.1 methylated-DNA--protein-cysteine methyltransferase [Patiriisocius marinistellae]
MNTLLLQTPLGILSIAGDDQGLQKVLFLEEKNGATTSEILTMEIPLVLKKTAQQLKEYFNGSRNSFDILLNPQGTTFQKKVWEELSNIPYGKTCSYQKMANNLGDPKVIRAAASANGKNPISIIIPCHRVIGSDGSLTGYAGGLHRKKWLLEHESPVTQGALF